MVILTAHDIANKINKCLLINTILVIKLNIYKRIWKLPYSILTIVYIKNASFNMYVYINNKKVL